MGDWIRCPVCGHKLFERLEQSGAPAVVALATKCHSCKTVVKVLFYDGKVKRFYEQRT